MISQTDQRSRERRSRRRGRFGERSKRVTRRKERDTFRHVVMPACFFFGVIGLLGLVGCFMHFAVTETVALHVVGMSLSLVVLPCLFAAYGLVRGHHSDALNEP